MLTDSDQRVIQQMDGENLNVLIWQFVYDYRCVPAKGVMRGATGFVVVDKTGHIVSSMAFTSEQKAWIDCRLPFYTSNTKAALTLFDDLLGSLAGASSYGSLEYQGNFTSSEGRGWSLRIGGRSDELSSETVTLAICRGAVRLCLENMQCRLEPVGGRFRLRSL